MRLPNSVKDRLRHCNSAKELWDNLQNLYSAKRDGKTNEKLVEVNLNNEFEKGNISSKCIAYEEIGHIVADFSHHNDKEKEENLSDEALE